MRVAIEVKLLIGALGRRGPHKRAGAPKGPPWRPKTAKNDHKSKK